MSASKGRQVPPKMLVKSVETRMENESLWVMSWGCGEKERPNGAATDRVTERQSGCYKPNRCRDEAQITAVFSGKRWLSSDPDWRLRPFFRILADCRGFRDQSQPRLPGGN